MRSTVSHVMAMGGLMRWGKLARTVEFKDRTADTVHVCQTAIQIDPKDCQTELPAEEHFLK